MSGVSFETCLSAQRRTLMRFPEDTWGSQTEGETVAGQREDGGRERNRTVSRASYGAWESTRRLGNQGGIKAVI